MYAIKPFEARNAIVIDKMYQISPFSCHANAHETIFITPILESEKEKKRQYRGDPVFGRLSAIWFPLTSWTIGHRISNGIIFIISHKVKNFRILPPTGNCIPRYAIRSYVIHLTLLKSRAELASGAKVRATLLLVISWILRGN